MNGDSEPGLLHHFADWGREFVSALVLALLGWIGWLYRLYAKDRELLTEINAERDQYRERFGTGIIEHAQDIEDALEEHEAELNRCRRIHDGMADGETGPKMIAGLRKEIAAVDNRLSQHILDDMSIRRGIDQKLDKIIEKLEG